MLKLLCLAGAVLGTGIFVGCTNPEKKQDSTASIDKAAKINLEQFNGVWKVESYKDGDKDQTDPCVKDATLTFNIDNTVTVEGNKGCTAKVVTSDFSFENNDTKLKITRLPAGEKPEFGEFSVKSSPDKIILFCEDCKPAPVTMTLVPVK